MQRRKRKLSSSFTGLKRMSHSVKQAHSSDQYFTTQKSCIAMSYCTYYFCCCCCFYNSARSLSASGSLPPRFPLGLYPSLLDFMYKQWLKVARQFECISLNLGWSSPMKFGLNSLVKSLPKLHISTFLNITNTVESQITLPRNHCGILTVSKKGENTFHIKYTASCKRKSKIKEAYKAIVLKIDFCIW